ncbi:uncharacterized protein PG986_001342 [Apiospora aurea]|uniref:Myb-like domain-containing protein n=1 Tax=Apiospora aurea TaxID=335848 RepID=A0ABR1QYB2_9PEZI
MTPEQERSIIFLVLMRTNPALSGGSWTEIAPKVGLGHEIVRKKFAAMRKAFLESQAAKGGAESSTAASSSKKRGRTNKAADEEEEEDAERDASQAKRQRRGRRSNKGNTPAAKVGADSDEGSVDEVSLQPW